MIFTIPLTILYVVLSGLIGLLPISSGLPVALQTGASWIFGFLWNFDFILDVPTLIQIILLTLAFETAILFWHFLHWALAKIPFLHIR